MSHEGIGAARTPKDARGGESVRASTVAGTRREAPSSTSRPMSRRRQRSRRPRKSRRPRRTRPLRHRP